MAVTRYSFRNPSTWRELEEVSNRLARVFDDPAAALTGSRDNGAWMPAVNVTETKDELMLTAELPGMNEENVSVDLENNVLTISGEKSETRTEGDEDFRYHVWERRFGSFQRSFTLPRSVKGDEIRATFDNGILTIHMPKVPEAKGRKITIEGRKRIES